MRTSLVYRPFTTSDLGSKIGGDSLSDEKKLKEIKRLEKISQDKVDPESNKQRDWEGKIKFKSTYEGEDEQHKEAPD